MLSSHHSLVRRVHSKHNMYMSIIKVKLKMITYIYVDIAVLNSILIYTDD